MILNDEVSGDGIELMAARWDMDVLDMEPNRNDSMRAMVDRYAEVARQVADNHGDTYVDDQAAMDNFLEKLSSYIL